MFLSAAPSTAYQMRILGQWQDARMVETYVPTAYVYPGMAVRSGDTELLGVLQSTLEALKADGTLATLVEKWALPPPPF